MAKSCAYVVLAPVSEKKDESVLVIRMATTCHVEVLMPTVVTALAGKLVPL